MQTLRMRLLISAVQSSATAADRRTTASGALVLASPHPSCCCGYIGFAQQSVRGPIKYAADIIVAGLRDTLCHDSMCSD
jgi:hypothetical protein